jgi:hypothetical protein
MDIRFSNCEKFFGTNGYTSTSANYIANKAKEIANGYATENISFLTKTATFVDKGIERPIERGLNQEEFEKLIANKLRIGDLNSLISWLREAIKAKESIISAVEHMRFNVWMSEMHPDIDQKTFGAELEENPIPENNCPDEDEWAIQHMSVKDINEYLSLKAICANLGKFVHPNGDYANARNEMLKKNGTSKVNDYQANTVIYDYIASIDPDIIEDKFLELQELHRSYQRRLNDIRFNIENEVRKLNDEYTMLVDKYHEIETRNNIKIDAARQKYTTEFSEWKIKRLDEVRKYKIIIPNDLKPVVDLVNNKQD